MYVEIISNGGHSFIGAIDYVSHDEGANTRERVEFVETVNLGTQNPEVAARVMAATAMNAENLKRQAGTPMTGRKAERGAVMHLLLSWAEDEIPGLTPEQKIRAAKDAVAQIGKDTTKSKKVKNGYRYFGDECQAVIVGHRDKDHPHVHVVLNQVHPEHGRLLPDGHDFNRLSRWAQQYQIEHGNEHLTPQRTINNEARRRGEWVKHGTKQNRRDYDRAKKVGDEAKQKVNALIKQQNERAAGIKKEQRQAKEQQKAAWNRAEAIRKAKQQQIEAAGKERLAQIEKARRSETAKRKQSVRDAFRERWLELEHSKLAEMRAFKEREKQVLGRLQNALKAIDWKRITKGEPGHRFTDAFGAVVQTGKEAAELLGSAHAREEAFKQDLKRQGDELYREQKKVEDAAAKAESKRAQHQADKAKQQRLNELRESREAYTAERAELLNQEARDQERIKASWQDHDRQRSQEWKVLQAEHPRVEPPGRTPLDAYVAKTLAERTKPSDLASNKGHGTDTAARAIDDYVSRHRPKPGNQAKPQADRQEDKDGERDL